MKLSEMTTPQFAECAARMVAPIGRLTKTKEVQSFFKKHASKEMSGTMALAAMMELLPVFLRDHYADTVEVISALTGKTIEEINAQPGMRTIADVRDSWDRELLHFFR